MVLFPEELKISRSLRKVLKRGGCAIRVDGAFREVMEGCGGALRPAGNMDPSAMIGAYARLHEAGRPLGGNLDRGTAGGRPLRDWRWDGRSSGNRCSPAPPMLRKSRWRFSRTS